MIKKGIYLCLNIVQNVLSNFSGYKLTHIVESSDWAIKHVGESIVYELNKQNLMRSRLSLSPIGLRRQIVHFDSVSTFLSRGKIHRPHASNKIILTWFHVEPEDRRLEQIKDAQNQINWIHTSCQSTKEQLIRGGIQEEKIIIIPLGVKLNVFTPTSQKSKIDIRKRLGIPVDRIIIGSFQKDGVGWGIGAIPKLIKGPDIFVQTITNLKHLHPFVLLTGPARGYIKQELEKNGIEYKHIYLKQFSDISDIYHALDLYLISSRIEGGPLSLLEAWASGVPVVGTRVGMIPDIAVSEQTALLSDSEDTASLSKQIIKIIEDDSTRQKIISNALQEVQKYSWEKIAKQYEEKLYRSLV